MSRDQSLLGVLESSARLQFDIALILEAKALEAEKMRSWLCNHVDCNAFSSQEELVKEAILVHEQVVDIIEGLSKLGQGMSRTMKVVLRQDQEDKDALGGMFGGAGGMGGDGKFP